MNNSVIQKIISTVVFTIAFNIVNAQTPFDCYAPSCAKIAMLKLPEIQNITYNPDTLSQVSYIELNSKSGTLAYYDKQENLLYQTTLNPLEQKWWTKDPLAQKFPYYSPYLFAGDNPIRYIDYQGKFLVDPNGKLIFIPIGTDIATHSADNKGAKVTIGLLFTNDGKTVIALKNESEKKGWDTDCHGQTFTKGKYWIDNNQVSNILEGDNYEKIEDKNKLKVGDIVVYRNSSTGEIEDSRTIKKIDKKTGKILVYGQGGLEEKNTTTDIDETWEGKQSYYRKKDKDVKLTKEQTKSLKKEVKEKIEENNKK